MKKGGPKGDFSSRAGCQPWRLARASGLFGRSGLHAQGSGVVFLGEEFQVNTSTTYNQRAAAVAIDNVGDFVVVWQSVDSGGDDNDELSVQGQRYSADGTPVGGEFQVNTFTTGSQHQAEVAAGPSGDFVIVWLSDRIGIPPMVIGQRYDSNGARIGDELLLGGPQAEYPSVATQPDGFVVVWRRPFDYEGVIGRRFASDGSPEGKEFIVNTYTTVTVFFPEVAADNDGDFVVVWHDYRDYFDGYDIRGRRFASSGAPIGDDFRVNDDPAGEQFRPAVATASGTGFVVVWEHADVYHPVEIRGRRFDSTGTAVSGDFLVDELNNVGFPNSRVALDDNSNALILWDEVLVDGDDVHAGLFNVSGERLGDLFQINGLTTNHQNEADVALAANGEAVVVWTGETSSGTDTSLRSVQARQLVLPLFADGFESGDTKAWNATVP